ncbi:RagB/SusD family nutrient uptake outer membrane protein [Dyadobacter fermentans]|uniref:RagB/SusD domain protein n=1 Tax=Dyadobacter fermentans (strain ATCC 700827 / DSM 18053 / CIP 107007 / KCTC 52180 / NS114) TaxID=471854 RepID=C6VZN6_DYAFD|nr:RagB/SusD family nutrient uptake outer membrane protein [Dyadobacter fermentans]ACT93514.1 RagB/SusD domain protein [Dyadobacter fermentans DSM 18053]
MKKTLIIGIVAVMLSGCKEDFLNLTPPTSLSSATYFQNEEQFRQAINGAYTPMRELTDVGVYDDEMRSDNTFFTIYQANRGLDKAREAYPQFLIDATASAIPNTPGSRWRASYRGIAYVNTIIDRLATNNAVSAEAKNAILGEALFLRAYYYFSLVTHFGGVPLLLKEVTNPEESFQPRNTAAEVYAQIKTDVKSAIDLLPVASTFPQSGRATKGAAKMLLAYALMSGDTRDYAAAEKELLDITKMNYALLPDYAKVFDPTNKNHQESIFDVQYMADRVSGQQSAFAWQFMPKVTNPQFLMGFDGGRMNIFSGWNVPTDEMVASYEKGDLRLPASIAVVEGTISGVEDFTAELLTSPVNYTPKAGKAFRYMIRKYFHPPYDIAFNTPDNFPVYRYSGALLLLAECLVQQNKAAAALPYLNQVRRRAGLPDLGAATLDAVSKEMRHELAFENRRWQDLIRIGKAIEVATAKGNRLKAQYGWILPAAFNVTPQKLLDPIPFRETQINTQLEQNPGY